MLGMVMNTCTMDKNFENEKISIKNLLFTKAIPNYIVPIATDGRPVFTCTDCGDKFLIRSSYEYHVHRKSLKITYACRYCHEEIIFLNRCNLLSHIRSHVFKTATINVSDLKIEPLPLTYFNYQNQTNHESHDPLEIDEPLVLPTTQVNTQVQNDIYTSSCIICFDCKKNIHSSGIMYRDRAKHYSQFTNTLYSCPVCLLTLPTQCALKAHIRLHIKEPPYYCPECGIHLGNKSIIYPYSHDCESFRMMRVTAKHVCVVKDCNKILHPTETYKHIKNNHLKSVYKCSGCSVACYKVANMEKHLTSHNIKVKILEFLQCELCPGRLVIPGQIEKHLKSHENRSINDVYPCWTCGATFKLAKCLVQHQISKHQNAQLIKVFGNKYQKLESITEHPNTKTRSLLHKHMGSKKCHKCSSNSTSQSSNIFSVPNKNLCNCVRKIVCHICKQTIFEDWNVIKEHYDKFHKEHVCLDIKIVINKLNKTKIGTNITRKRKKVNLQNKIDRNVNIQCNTQISNKNETGVDPINGKFICGKCDKGYGNKQLLEEHIISHKDPFMAYQCMECAESFISKPSFSTHLLLKHGITNVSDYIDKKKCYNKDSVHTHMQKHVNFEKNELVKENQCSICREQFCNSVDLEKHFRVHGMAFLMKNTKKAGSSDKI